jgi:hypothetical protein
MDSRRVHGDVPSCHRARSDEGRRRVTVCVATLFRWNYGTKEAPVLGTAGIAISDRKITTLDVEYEPSYLKLGFITPRALVLVAGDFAFSV